MFPSPTLPAATEPASVATTTPPSPSARPSFANDPFAVDFERLAQIASPVHTGHPASCAVTRHPATSPCTLRAPIVSARETPSGAAASGREQVFVALPGDGAIATSLLACSHPSSRDAFTAFGPEAEAMAGEWKRRRTMAELAAQPRDSRFVASADGLPAHPPHAVLHRVLVMLSGGPQAIAAAANTLEWQAFDTTLAEGSFAEARQLLEALARRLEADHTLEHWGTAFEQLLALSHRFESRMSRAIGQTLMLPDCTCDEAVSALAARVTRARFDRLMSHRLNAAASFPDQARESAWRDLLGTLPRCTTLFNAERLATLAKFIVLLPEAHRPQAALDVADASARLREPGGRAALVGQLCDTLDSEVRLGVIQRLLQAAVPGAVDDLRETVEALAQELHRLPERDAAELLHHLTRLAAMEGEYETLLFDDAQSIELMSMLRHISDCDKRGYPRPELRALVRHRAFVYADAIAD